MSGCLVHNLVAAGCVPAGDEGEGDGSRVRNVGKADPGNDGFEAKLW